MGDCIEAQVLDKLHDFVNDFETEGGQDIWHRVKFSRSYQADPSVEWTDKKCTLRAIRFVKTLAVCCHNADWSGVDEDVASLFMKTRTYFKWLKDDIPKVGVSMSFIPWRLSDCLWAIAMLHVRATKIYGKLVKLPLGVVLDKFAHSVQQYVMNIPKEPIGWGHSGHGYYAVETNYRLTLKRLECFMYLLSNTGNNNKFSSRSGDLILWILHLARTNDMQKTDSTAEMEEIVFHSSSDMSLRLSPHHHPDVMELCVEALSAKLDPPPQIFVESFLNLLGSAPNDQVTYLLDFPMVHLPLEELLRNLFIPVDHVVLSTLLHKLDLFMAEFFVMPTSTSLGENQAATVGEALMLLTKFFKRSAEYMENQHNVILKIIVYFLRGAARSFCDSRRISEDMIQHSSLAICMLYKAEFFLTLFRRFKSDAVNDAPDDKRSFMSLRELLSGTPDDNLNEVLQTVSPVQRNQLIELNLEDIITAYEQGGSLSLNDITKSGRVELGDHLLGRLRKLWINKPHAFGILKDQVITLLRELELMGSFLKDSKDRYIGLTVTRLIYEAEYIIDMFLLGDAPLCYQQLLFFNAIQQTKLIKAQIAGESFELSLIKFDDRAKIIVDLFQNGTKNPEMFHYFLNEVQDEGTKEYWRNYVYRSYVLNSSVHWTDAMSRLRAANFLKTIQFIYNAQWGGMEDDKDLALVLERRKRYFRWLEGEIIECDDQASKYMTTIGSFCVKFGDICDKLMKIPHPAVFVDGDVFDEFSELVQKYVMNVSTAPLGWGRSSHEYSVVEANYSDSVRKLERFKCCVCSVSKKCVEPGKLQSLLTRAAALVFSIMHMAHRNDVHEKTDSRETEGKIFRSSSVMSCKLSPQNQDAMMVYLEILSANVDMIKALNNRQSVCSESFLNFLQATQNQAQVLGEILDFPIMDLIVDQPDHNEHVDILLKQGYAVLAREAASFFSLIPPNHHVLTNLLHKLNVTKGEIFVLEVLSHKGRLTCFGGNQAATIREVFRTLSQFFKMPKLYMGYKEKSILRLIQSFLREAGSLCELPEDTIVESSLAILKLFKAEALFMVLRLSTSGFKLLAQFRITTIQKILLVLRELVSGTPNGNLFENLAVSVCSFDEKNQPPCQGEIDTNFEEVEGVYMSDLWLLFQNFPRSDGLVFTVKLLGNLKKFVSKLPDTAAVMEKQLQLLLSELELFVSFLKDCRNKGLESRIIFFMHAAEYIIEKIMLGGGPLCYHQLVLFIAIQEAQFLKEQILNHCPDQKSSLEDTQLSSEPETFDGSSQEAGQEELIDVFGDQVQSIIVQLKTGRPLQVVSLVGMAGIGKTTLAKKVYGSPSITQHFDVCAFCCISQVYRKREVLLDILAGFVEVTDDMKKKDANGLEEEVKQNLIGKRYLIIVDDIWYVEHFYDLKLSLPNNNKGSKILVTTREGKLAEKLNRRGVHHVPLLKTPDSWKLLQAMLFGDGKCPKELVEVGWLIAKNCRGLPLAIAVVSGILKKLDMEKGEWEEISKHLKSIIADDKARHFMDILEFSYNHLPSYLKPCYLYLASFLEDQEIPVKKLQWLWISEGFIPKMDSKSLGETADGYLEELMNRSLVMEVKKSSMGGTKTCLIHDMLRDLCLIKAKQDNFVQLMSMDDSNDSADAHVGVQYRVCVHSTKNNFTLLRPSPPHVHTLLFFATNSFEDKESYDISTIYENLQFVRVLDLESIACCIGNQILDIDRMLGLNYLAIKGDIKSVPSSISKLWNLETLVVKGTRGEVALPSSLWSMTTLKNVHIRPRASMNCDYGYGVRVELPNLTTFSTPAFSENVKGILERWIRLIKLRCIIQAWKFFPQLELLISLESLNLYYIGTQAPYDFGFPANLKKLTLSKFSWSWEHMSTISTLSNLEVLKLLFKSFVGDTWDMGEEEFPSLKFLKLENLNLANWYASSDHFPMLERLVLRNCKKLEEVPPGFDTIYTLQMIEVHWCSQSATTSAKPIYQQQHESGNRNFGLMITPQEWDFRTSDPLK